MISTLDIPELYSPRGCYDYYLYVSKGKLGPSLENIIISDLRIALEYYKSAYAYVHGERWGLLESEILYRRCYKSALSYLFELHSIGVTQFKTLEGDIYDAPRSPMPKGALISVPELEMLISTNPYASFIYIAWAYQGYSCPTDLPPGMWEMATSTIETAYRVHEISNCPSPDNTPLLNLTEQLVYKLCNKSHYSSAEQLKFSLTYLLSNGIPPFDSRVSHYIDPLLTYLSLKEYHDPTLPQTTVDYCIEHFVFNKEVFKNTVTRYIKREQSYDLTGRVGGIIYNPAVGGIKNSREIIEEVINSSPELRTYPRLAESIVGIMEIERSIYKITSASERWVNMERSIMKSGDTNRNRYLNYIRS